MADGSLAPTGPGRRGEPAFPWWRRSAPVKQGEKTIAEGEGQQGGQQQQAPPPSPPPPPREHPRRRSTDRPPTDPVLTEIRDVMKSMAEGFAKVFDNDGQQGEGQQGGQSGGEGNGTGKRKPRGSWFYGRRGQSTRAT